jgi:chloramphenicol-sensitive protein RarD
VNPLANVVIGVVVLRERLSRPQKLAVGLAGIGVSILGFSTGAFPWLSLILAATFATYGLLRKIARVESLSGLFVETLLVAPFAATYLVLRERAGLGSLGQHGLAHGLLVAAAGPITALPLLWFTAAARRMPLSTLGFFQYLAPTLQFLLAVLAFGERLTVAHLVTFAFIWTALAIFTYGAMTRAEPPAPPRHP